MSIGSISEEIDKLKREWDQCPTLERLSELRKVMFEAQRANNANEGIRKLLTELYPDTAHFIYELLQNAQDANKDNKSPTTVIFMLTGDRLVFEHSGRPFDIKDIEAITNIGEGTKKGDSTSIGKFGVGFKSVFAYTERPEIHSGEYSFSIKDLLIPEKIESNVAGKSTKFILPFNNTKKPGCKAVSEIESELKKLPIETLLFLRSIGKIEYKLSDSDTLGIMERIDGEDGIAQISIETPNGEKQTYRWLCYKKDVTVNICEKQTNHTVAVAFELVDNSGEKHAGDWKVKPSDPGKVCIYFPAVKEASNLRFFIHAPFASTVARDSVRDDDGNGNDQLRDAIAELIAESLADIKKRGLLTVDFLAVLPNLKDGLSEFYEPIREAIVKAFNSEALVPTKSGSHKPARVLFRARPGVPEGICEVIDDNDLALLTGYDAPLWTEIVTEKQQSENLFLDSLELESWDKPELKEIFNPKSDTEREKIEKWLADRKVDGKYDHNHWLRRLYSLLGQTKTDVDNRLRLVKTTKGKFVKPSDAYFIPNDDKDRPDDMDDINFVEPQVYTGENDKTRALANEFLTNSGVRQYDERAKIQLRLDKYKNHDKILDKAYFEDIQAFVNYAVKHPRNCYVFANETFLFGTRDGKDEWVTPAQLKVAPPEFEEEILELKITHHRVWSGYTEESLGDKCYAAFDEFLKNINVKSISVEDLLKARAKKYLYNGTEPIEVSEHIIQDARKFLRHAKEKRDLVKNTLKDAYFVLGSDGYLHEASSICMDRLSPYTHIHGMHSVSSEYGDIRQELEVLLVEMGATADLKVQSTIARGYTCDYDIYNLHAYLRQIRDKRDENVALLICEAILSYNGDCTKHHTQARKVPYGDSILVTVLSSKEWIPQVCGDDQREKEVHFVKPSDARIEQLPESFHNLSYGLHNNETMLEIGLKIESSNNQDGVKEKVARYLDMSPEAVECIRFSNRSESEIQEFFKKPPKAKFPECTTPNPERRTQKDKDEYEHAPSISREIRERQVRTSSPDNNKQTYLRDIYTNSDGELVCQLCQEEMPFKLRDGDYYFESVEIASQKILKKESEFKYLALCPTCAAKYKEYIKRDEKEQKVIIDAICNCHGDMLEIDIKLDKPMKLRFTQKHMIDLKAIIAVDTDKQAIGPTDDPAMMSTRP